MRNHPTDRTLTDQQWQHIASEMMAAVGLAPHDDSHAVRWVAVRHGADHIHLVATLVRQDGRTAWGWNERHRAQAAARDLEQRYGLRPVAPADRTAHRRPGAAEINKSDREQRPEIPRDRLRREVRAAAAAATAEEDFFFRLRSAGLLVRLRHSTVNAGEVTGYAVGLPDHTTAAGDTVWYGGGRLAPDLTLPKLRTRWTGTAESRQPGTPSRSSARRARAYQRGARATRRAVDDLRASAGWRGPRAAESTVQAAADLLIAVARAVEGRRGGPLTDAADLFDRAARSPHGRPARATFRSGQLRALARLIAAMGRTTDERDTATALHLVLELALLADHLAELREAQHRLHQARDAQAAAERLRSTARTALAATVPSQPTLPLLGGWPTDSRTTAAHRP